MSKNQKRGSGFQLASLAITAGLALALPPSAVTAKAGYHVAQATPPLQTSPPESAKDVPAEPKPGGTRPTTPAPEPARPSDQAQKEGAKAALPPAPPEKIAPPMQTK